MKYSYIEHETMPDIKLAVFETAPFEYKIQLVDHQSLMDEVTGLTGCQVVRYGQQCGFEMINPDMTKNNIVQFQHVSYA